MDSSHTSREQSYASNSPYPSIAPTDVVQDDFNCPECGGTSCVENAGATICTTCGYVDSEGSISNDKYQFYDGVQAIEESGLSTTEHSRGVVSVRSPFYKQADVRRRTTARARRQRDEKYIQSAGRLIGSTNIITNRAKHLYKRVGEIWSLRSYAISHRTALSCLLIASREQNILVSLTKIASVSSQSIAKLGAVYKKLRMTLIEQGAIEADLVCNTTEDDIWMELGRLLNVRDDQLPPQIRDWITVTSSNPRSRKLRINDLISVCQKFLVMATECGLSSGRKITGTLGACVILAFRYHLKSITKNPVGLLEFVVDFFMVTEKVVVLRMREMEKLLRIWVKKLPYRTRASNKRIPSADLVDYMDEIFQVFGRLHGESNEVWRMAEDNFDTEDAAALDDDAQNDSDKDGDNDDNDDNDVDDDDNLEDHHGRRIPDELRDIFKQMEQTCEENSKVNIPSIFMPPRFQAAVKRRETQEECLRIAKQTLSSSATTTTTSGTDNDTKPADNLLGDETLKQMRILLKLGTRSDQELVDASSEMLAEWAEHDASPRPRPTHDLDSEELSSKDLTEEEWINILRDEQGAKAHQRVMASAFESADKARKKRVEEERIRESRRLENNEKDTNNYIGAGYSRHKRRCLRSSKVNYTALEQMEKDLGHMQKKDDDVPDYIPSGLGRFVHGVDDLDEDFDEEEEEEEEVEEEGNREEEAPADGYDSTGDCEDGFF
ncbi:hypothetical protein BG004_006783 [Podila humilis]|nr:hypothetical protein BG004_006783 [Podila humilis]